jgi:hypothetical protein
MGEVAYQGGIATPIRDIFTDFRQNFRLFESLNTERGAYWNIGLL